MPTPQNERGVTSSTDAVVRPQPVAPALRIPRLLVWVLDVAFIAALLLVAGAWVMDPLRLQLGRARLITSHFDAATVLAPLLLFLLRDLIRRGAQRTGASCSALWEKRDFRRLTLSLVATYAFFGALEGALALAGCQASAARFQFMRRVEAGRLIEENMLPDPDVIYGFKPGSLFLGRRINRLGFRDREVDPVKRPGTIRVICMGDSITAQGRPGYSQYLHERLTNAPPTPQPWEAFNMGVYGYSSLQGLRLFQTRGRSLEPDVVTVFFSWNDQWLTGITDRAHLAIEKPPLRPSLSAALQRKRCFSWFSQVLRPVHLWFRANVRPRQRLADGTPRVPPEDYRATLTEFMREIRSAGAIPVLITAPSRNLADSEVRQGHIRSVEEGNRIHAQYVAITREVAAETGTDLLDLAAIFAGPDCDAYFADDGIHFDFYSVEGELDRAPARQPGLDRIGREIDRKLREIVASRAWKTTREGRAASVIPHA